jgi:hypothetical protein
MDADHSMDDLIARVEALSRSEEEIAKAVGLLIIYFNRLERDVGYFLATLLQSTSEHVVNALFASMSFGQKVDLLAALYLERFREDGSRCEKCRSVVQQLRNFEEARNKYAHSWWGAKQFANTDVFVRVKIRTKGGKGLVVSEEQTVPNDLTKVCEQIVKFSWLDLADLYGSLSDSVSESTETLGHRNSGNSGPE